MTVRINKPALNLREELTKAQSVVPYSQQQFWMDGFVENGTFDDGTTGWTAVGGVLSVVSGTLKVEDTSGTFGYAIQNFSTEVGKKYAVSLDLVDTSNSTGNYVILGSTSDNDLYTNSSLGTTPNTHWTFTFVAQTNASSIRFTGGLGIGKYTTYDNVAVFEIDENDNVIHSLPLGFKPLHVYEDGLIQREGDVHDYTVVKTGGAYAIKPTVQPTATTETCVIAEREL